MIYTSSSPAAMSGISGSNVPPICHNCRTSTTPLWRRDESGAVLCNACGLFLKLHGTPRPISLKTDVIKSRNRVKTAGQGQKRKSLFDEGSLLASQSQTTTTPLARRLPRSGASDRSHSPVSRTETPSIYPSNIAPQQVFDPSFPDQSFQSPAPPLMQPRHSSPGSSSPFNDRILEPPQSFDGLQRENSALRTRVKELEMINDLYKGTVTQYEQHNAPQSSAQSEAAPQDTESQLRHSLEEAIRREQDLKRRVDELEHELADLKGEQPPAKKTRTSEGPLYPEPPQSILDESTL